jgi:hypothetical protein
MDPRGSPSSTNMPAVTNAIHRNTGRTLIDAGLGVTIHSGSPAT